MKLEQRKQRLARMSRSESFKFLVQERMANIAQILHNKYQRKIRLYK